MIALLPDAVPDPFRKRWLATPDEGGTTLVLAFIMGLVLLKDP